MKFFFLSLFCTLFHVRGEALFPENDWETASPKEVGFHEKKFKKFIDYAFDPKGHEDHRTNSLIVIKDGKLIFEGYHHPFHRDSKQLLWSASKTFSGVLAGIAIKKGLINFESKVSDYFPEVKKKTLTFKHLLNMSSGIDWNEGYGASAKSNVVQMLYSGAAPSEDMAIYAATRGFKNEPGEQFYYSSGETNLMMGVLKRALGENYRSFPRQNLFEPLGINSFFWESDGSGNYVGSSYLYMNARDVARFGWMLANGGRWKENEIISPKYFEFMKTQAPSFARTDVKGFGQLNRRGYGGHIWLNIDQKEKDLPRAFPAAPESMLMALGVQGQMIAIFPEEKMVVVRLGADKKGRLNRKKFFKKLFKALDQKEEML